jgi:4-hydroxy-2-oxoheptanedioate aldolase
MESERIMVTNRAKEKWMQGEVAWGAWLAIPSSLSSEAIARAGYDYVCVDLQHGLIDYPDAAEMLVAIAGAGATPFVRVPDNDFASINRALDAGAMGIVIPMIHSSDDTSRCVSACRYPPEGTRSYGPIRAAMSAGPDYFERANELIACVPMIETRQAFEEIDSILAVPGVDAVYVGPNDLSLALGQGPGADNEGAYQQAYQTIAGACEEHGVVAGIHAKSSLAAKHESNGFKMVTISTDLSLIQQGAARDLDRARNSTKKGRDDEKD